jgi:hypothetical protein
MIAAKIGYWQKYLQLMLQRFPYSYGLVKQAWQFSKEYYSKKDLKNEQECDLMQVN